MEAEIFESSSLQEKTGEVVRNEKGKFVTCGNPNGRPPGSKNKFTMVKEALVDAFLNADGQEAFQNTLVYDELLPGADGKKKKLMNLEALRAVLRVLPREDLSSGNTYNFNLIVGELKALTPEQLRSIIAARPRNDGVGGGEGLSVT